MVDRIHKESERLGIVIRTSIKVHLIERAAGGIRVVYEQDDTERSIVAERIVNGAGRVANVDSLDLDTGRVQHDGTRLTLDDRLRSVSNNQVHACGDVLWNTPQLSPVATYEGRIVGQNIVEGPCHRPDYSSIPACVYTIPAIASVGMTEAKARESGIKIKVQATDMNGWISSRTHAESTAWAKVIVDEATNRILGVHIVGHAGEELINIFALAIRHGIPATALRDQIYGYPTFSADIKYLL